MKETVIFTMGTRGDIQPYIYLARALEEAGIHAIIGTHPCWRKLVLESGVAFSPIGPDIDIEKEAAVIRGKAKNPAFSMLRTMKFVFGVIQNSLSDILRTDTMISIGSIPHSWLFRQGYCVVHYCGFGTASSSILYAIPSIPVPHVLDQFGFAQRLYELGVSSAPINASDLSEERVIAAIEDMKLNYDLRKSRASELSVKLREENGLRTAVSMIKKIIQGETLSE